MAIGFSRRSIFRGAFFGFLGTSATQADAGNVAQQPETDAAQVLTGEVPGYESRAIASSRPIPAGVGHIRLNYYNPTYSSGATLVGGARYRRVSLKDILGYPTESYFRSVDRFLPDGTTDLTAGGYWVLAEWPVNITHFGAVADATGSPGIGTDSTAAIHAAIEWCKLTGAPVRVPAGQFRVTSGYTHIAEFQEIVFIGEGEVTRNKLGVNPSSAIILDNPSAASFFYRATGASGIRVSGLTFGCAQEVKDRKFFRFSEGEGIKQIFRDVVFVRVEKPVVYEAGSYFQWSSYENVAFRNSGTIHSEVTGVQGNINTLVGTGLTLINISHDGGVPDSTEKVVMNLQGIREIQSFTLLLEGALPSAGWTILKCDCLYNNNWSRIRVATFVGTHIEWSGGSSNITYLLDLGSGRYLFEAGYFFPAGTQKIRLNGYAEIEFEGLAATNRELVNDRFVFNGIGGHVTFTNSTLRIFRASDNRFTVRNCRLGTLDTQARQGNAGASLVARWDGGYPDGTLLALVKSSTVGFYPSVDATYGRKMVFLPAANGLDPSFTTPLARFTAGDQITFLGKLKLPTYSFGNIVVRVIEVSAVLHSVIYGPEYSGQVIEIYGGGTINGGTSGRVALAISASGITDLSDVLEIYSLAVFKGDDAPRNQHPDHTRNIATWNSGAPTGGEWARGDVVWNTAPSAGGAPGWMCTAGGTPGTWKAMAPLVT